MASLNVSVDPFAVAEPSELPDWRLPLSFMKTRHLEKIETTQQSDEWRMRDRVSGKEFTHLRSMYMYLPPSLIR